MPTQKKRLEVQFQLRVAVQMLNARGLNISSKWACEQLMGMNGDEISDNEDQESMVALADFQYDKVPPKEVDILLFSRSLINNCEFQRCAHLLRRSNGNKSNTSQASSGDTAAASKLLNGAVVSQLGLFLAAYSMYMAGEKLKEQQQANDGMLFLRGQGDKNASSTSGGNKLNNIKKGFEGHLGDFNDDLTKKKNPFLDELFVELEPLYRDKQMDGFLLYIFAIVIRDLVKQGCHKGQGGKAGLTLFNTSDIHHNMSTNSNNRQPLSAYKIFLESLQLYPWNW